MRRAASLPVLVIPPWQTLAAAGVLGRNQAKICHELSWLGEAGDIAKFGNQCCRHHHGHAAQCLKCLYDWCERPRRQRRLDMRLQTIQPGSRRIHCFEATFENDVMWQTAISPVRLPRAASWLPLATPAHSRLPV